MDGKAECLENETLCVALAECKVKPHLQELGHTCNYPDQNDCERQLHCFYEPSSLTYRLACESKVATAVSKAECGALSSRDACRRQAICSWVFFEVTQVCENNGTMAGCVPRGGGDLLGLQDLCALHKTKTSCATEADLCEWAGQCSCPSPFFGDFCEKERVQFVSHDGLCVGAAANSSVCKGLAIAATSEDWPFCNPEQDCTTWNEVKKVVITIYECELGDLFADLLGFLGTLICVILSCRCCLDRLRCCCCSLDAEELQKFLGARFFEFFRGSCVKVLDSVAFGMCVMCLQISSHSLSMFHRF